MNESGIGEFEGKGIDAGRLETVSAGPDTFRVMQPSKQFDIENGDRLIN